MSCLGMLHHVLPMPTRQSQLLVMSDVMHPGYFTRTLHLHASPPPANKPLLTAGTHLRRLWRPWPGPAGGSLQFIHPLLASDTSPQVELPHSNLTYKSLRLVPYAQLSWKTEYSGNFTKKPAGQPYKGACL